MHVWRPVNTRYHKRHIVETNRSGYVSVNMFGWIWSGGPGELTRITSRFTGELMRIKRFRNRRNEKNL